MLKMKKQCETCQAPTALEGNAYICSFECTFCQPCTEQTHKHICPNCSGELVKRPTRVKSPAKVVGEQVKKKIGKVFS